MRNAAQIPQQPPQSQQSLNESIERTKALMQQMQTLPNREAMINNLLQSNPQLGMISTMLRNGNNLEGIAKQMAQMGGFDLNSIINRLSENIR